MRFHSVINVHHHDVHYVYHDVEDVVNILDLPDQFNGLLFFLTHLPSNETSLHPILNAIQHEHNVENNCLVFRLDDDPPRSGFVPTVLRRVVKIWIPTYNSDQLVETPTVESDYGFAKGLFIRNRKVFTEDVVNLYDEMNVFTDLFDQQDEDEEAHDEAMGVSESPPVSDASVFTIRHFALGGARIDSVEGNVLHELGHYIAANKKGLAGGHIVLEIGGANRCSFVVHQNYRKTLEDDLERYAFTIAGAAVLELSTLR